MSPPHTEDMASSLEVLDAQVIPIELGASLLSDKRPSANGDTAKSLEFGFLYRDIPFGVTALAQGSSLHMVLSAYLGLIPYLVQDQPLRDDIVTILGSVPSHNRFHFEVTNTQQLFLQAAPSLEIPHTPIRILATITACVLEADLYLDCLLAKLRESAAQLAAEG